MEGEEGALVVLGEGPDLLRQELLDFFAGAHPFNPLRLDEEGFLPQDDFASREAPAGHEAFAFAFHLPDGVAAVDGVGLGCHIAKKNKSS